MTVTVPNASSATCSACLGLNQGPYGLAAAPFELGRGAKNETIAVVGFNFVAGSWGTSSIVFSPAAGITVHSVSRVNSVLLLVTLSIDPLAATTARSFTVINPDGGRTMATNGFTITPAPVVTSLNPASRGKGATNENVVITGSNFRTGTWLPSSVSFSVGGVVDTGITVNSVTRTDSTHLTVNLAIATGAATGARDVNVRNTDGGRATKSNAFTVNAAPTIASISPTSRPQGASSQTVLINGAFSTGTWTASAVSFSGTGVTVNSVVRNGAGTQLSVNLSVASNATVGPRSVTVRNPSDGGRATLANGFTVNAKPTITSLSPNSRPRPQTNLDIVITGTGFVTGSTVSFSGTGINIVSTTFMDASHIKVRVNITSSAAKGDRDVTVTNPDGGTIKLVKGFKVT